MNNIKLLLIDNDRTFIELFSETLIQYQYEVTCAHNLEEGSRLLNKDDHDIAIIDLRLQDDVDGADVSGITLAKSTRSTKPKILFTNHGDIDIFDKSMQKQYGDNQLFDFVLPKTAELNRLVERINEILPPVQISTQLDDFNQNIKNKVDNINQNYIESRKQARFFYLISSLFAIIGCSAIVGGTMYSGFVLNDASVFSAAFGIIIDAIAILLYRRADKANMRVDIFHQESIKSSQDAMWFRELLKVCESLNPEHAETCKENIIENILNRLK